MQVTGCTKTIKKKTFETETERTSYLGESRKNPGKKARLFPLKKNNNNNKNRHGHITQAFGNYISTFHPCEMTCFCALGRQECKCMYFSL